MSLKFSTSRSVTTKPISVATVALAASGTTAITLPAFAQPAVSTLTAHGLGTYSMGLYATFAKPDVNGGAWTQVSRLSAPLVNELVIGLPDKDRYSASEPKDDGHYEIPDVSQ